MLRPLIPKLSICKLGSRGRVMDVIVEKVLTPEWLIEGTLFILLASVIPRISKYILRCSENMLGGTRHEGEGESKIYAEILGRCIG